MAAESDELYIEFGDTTTASMRPRPNGRGKGTTTTAG
jgi:hypothetical protein